MKTFAPAAAIAVACLMIAGCGSKPRTPQPVARPPVTTLPPVALPGPTEAAYVASAGSIDLFVIRASELAERRAQALRVREVASRLISSHKGTSQQLSFAGRRLNLLPSATMEAAEQAAFDRLTAAPDFDSAYTREIKAAVEKGLSIHRRYAQSGRSPTLKPVAKMASEAAERDMRLLTYL